MVPVTPVPDQVPPGSPVTNVVRSIGDEDVHKLVGIVHAALGIVATVIV